ncbi:GNAT family N-acetyltransferase [Neobacillus notoginsengisoli]|uniref:GNAT family N-acetyltransferase n=1 Tax=Neobacillus notoginsengisoli TaxID=1578198 RepID=A0A417YR91_9BACI|nr:GNAT family N-acetyltransferase [Neobacillus notoginsengisoli]RHW37219.1 GNAT family N-acetyltransferase [Neobacillus notoginsengisoli]
MEKAQRNEVALEFYQEHHRPSFEDYNLPEEQLKYTAVPLEEVKKCAEDSKRHPVVILHNGVPAGFFVLHESEGIREHSENPTAILLRGYSVSARHQGKGIARRSLELLPGFVKRNFPGKSEIVLAVNHANLAAQHVYVKAGFSDRGRRVVGPIGEQFVLHLGI